LSFGLCTVCAFSISSQTSGPRPPQIFAGMLQIGCETVIAKKNLKKKIHGKFSEFFFEIIFWNFFLNFFFENVVSGNRKSRSASNHNWWKIRSDQRDQQNLIDMIFISRDLKIFKSYSKYFDEAFSLGLFTCESSSWAPDQDLLSYLAAAATVTIEQWAHDYYSIWFNLSAAFFISEKKTGVIKLKTHYFISYHVMKC
jgi:hypothetical protein